MVLMKVFLSSFIHCAVQNNKKKKINKKHAYLTQDWDVKVLAGYVVDKVFSAHDTESLTASSNRVHHQCVCMCVRACMLLL